MHRWYYPALALLLGLFIAQVLATAQVYLSNAELSRTLAAIRESGYLTVPNENIISHLREFGPAFFGGLFFSLSLGAALCLLSFAAAWIWDRLFLRERLILLPGIIFWVFCLVIVNLRGLSPMVSLYFLLVPPVVFVTALRWMPAQGRQTDWLNRVLHLVPVLVLAVLWASQMDRNLFPGLRDNLLLSNSLGTKINNFYYDYTLYPAEVFKTLDQKMLKTCRLDAIQKEPVARALERELLNHDYLSVSSHSPVDLTITEDGNGLALINKRGKILRTTLGDFLPRPAAVLREFSSMSDPYALFRKFTFLSLLIAFPLALYLLLFTLLRLLLGLLLNLKTSSLIASGLCLCVGIILFIPLKLGEGGKMEGADLATALDAKSWYVRVAALKRIGKQGLDVGGFQAYERLRTSPHIPERYWLARALGVSRRPETYRDLLAFLDDPHPNVVNMAFYALGRRGDPRAVDEILKRIETSDNWYNQWHAYKALRNLGWKQKRKSYDKTSLLGDRIQSSTTPK
jgi:hypothetical protein